MMKADSKWLQAAEILPPSLSHIFLDGSVTLSSPWKTICVRPAHRGDKKQLQEATRAAKKQSSGLRLSKNMTQTSLWEELWVDVFKSFFVNDSAGAFLQDKLHRSFSSYIKDSPPILMSLP